MFAQIERCLTLGHRYVVASLVYSGLAFLLGGSALLDLSLVRADDEEPACSYTVEEDREGILVPVTYDGCPEGQQCCDGTCIPEGEICCEDGTHGDAENCECCADCSSGDASTITCD